MPLKFDPSQIINIYGRVTAGEVRATSPLSSKTGPLDLASKKMGEDIAKETMKVWMGLLVAIKLKDQKRQSKVTVALSAAALVIKELKELERDSKKVKYNKLNRNISFGDVTVSSISLVYKSRVNLLSPLNRLKTFLNVMVWPLCAAILARSAHLVTSQVVNHPHLKLSRIRPEDPSPFFGNLKLCVEDIVIVSWLQQAFEKYSISKRKFSRFGLRETYWGLESDERVLSPFSSLPERSFPSPSSNTERTISSSPYSGETLWVQPQILPLLVDTMPGFKTRYLLNSTKFEPTFQSDSILSVMLNLSEEIHVDFFEILQVFRDLKKCFIFTCVFCLNSCTSWICCFNQRVFGLIFICCSLKV